MARLHEHQGKGILKQFGITVPKGGVTHSPDEARAQAAQIGGPVVVKAQAWVTGRAGKNAIQFAEDADGAEGAARGMFGMQMGNFSVEQVLVEERVHIAREFYLGMIVDDSARAPVVLFSSVGGTGIEDIAAQHPDRLARHVVDIRTGLRDFEARDLARRAGIEGDLIVKLSPVITRFYDAARAYEARAAEINPLVLTADGALVAVDCRFTVDDYAVFRHPDLNIIIAREFDRPPTPLELVAWEVEKSDYRGTFYFIQMDTGFHKGERVVGFHGAGGGGSMMNMDALLRQGFRVANFVDTSGNPPASKVYRAARIILSQSGIDGYFAGGSGVASQEQYHSARGLVKAFMDEPLNVPAVIRLGGNAEEQAIAIMQGANDAFPAPVEAYGRDASPDFCTERLEALISTYTPVENPAPRPSPEPRQPYRFDTVTGGTITYDHAICRDCESKICIQTCAPSILSLEGDVPVLNISREKAQKGGCVECLACEVECYFHGAGGGRIDLPIHGLDEVRHVHSD
ncbi:MAG: acetate--CoA ligase family protein [Anaerolineae bacterium]|nr:acetate--CoA ligase family protein [Anaerolineae bacterium]